MDLATGAGVSVLKLAAQAGHNTDSMCFSRRHVWALPQNERREYRLWGNTFDTPSTRHTRIPDCVHLKRVHTVSGHAGALTSTS